MRHKLRLLTGTSALALALLVPGPPALAQANPGAPANSWKSWWSWLDDMVGISLDKQTYGSGPDFVIGSGRLVHQARPITGVRGVEIRGPVNLVVQQGKNEVLTLHTDDNIAPLIDTPVENGILRISIKPGASFRIQHGIGATLQVQHLESIKILGSGDLRCAQLQGELLELTVHGSGDVRIDALEVGAVAVLVQGSGDVDLSGRVPKQGFVIEGSGDIHAEELAGQDVAVRIGGSGDASVWATQSLSVEIGGSGDLNYRGEPKLTKNVHGSGEIQHH